VISRLWVVLAYVACEQPRDPSRVFSQSAPKCEQRYVPSAAATVALTLRATQTFGPDFLFKSICIRLDDDGAVMLTDALEMTGKTAERRFMVTPGTHTLVAWGEWKSAPRFGNYTFEVKTSHDVHTSESTDIALTFYELPGPQLQDRPRGRWTESEPQSDAGTSAQPAASQ